MKNKAHKRRALRTKKESRAASVKKKGNAGRTRKKSGPQTMHPGKSKADPTTKNERWARTRNDRVKKMAQSEKESRRQTVRSVAAVKWAETSRRKKNSRRRTVRVKNGEDIGGEGAETMGERRGRGGGDDKGESGRSVADRRGESHGRKMAADDDGGMTREMMASVLGETLAQTFDVSPTDVATLSTDALTFQSQRKPDMSIRRYLERICRYSGMSGEALLLSIVYLMRFGRANPTIPITSLNLHRLTLAASVCAAKFWDDDVIDNQRFAKIGGVSLTETNLLERTFCRLVDYSFIVDPDEYRVVAGQMLCSPTPIAGWKRPSLDVICRRPVPTASASLETTPSPPHPSSEVSRPASSSQQAAVAVTQQERYSRPSEPGMSSAPAQTFVPPTCPAIDGVARDSGRGSLFDPDARAAEWRRMCASAMEATKQQPSSTAAPEDRRPVGRAARAIFAPRAAILTAASHCPPPILTAASHCPPPILTAVSHCPPPILTAAYG